VVGVGKIRGSLEDAVRDYEARARRYWKLEVVDVAGGGPGSSAGPDAVREAEGQRILSRVPDDLAVVALTRGGRGVTSRELARYLHELGLRSQAGAAFVVGGAFGLSPAVLRRAQRRLALSTMTLPHEMARLLLAEQLYRAGTIIRGEPYHKA